MIRVEIIAHEALERPLVEALAPVPAGSHDPEGKTGRPFIMIRDVAGRGMSGSAFGDDVWPETNVKIILFVEEDEEPGIRESLKTIRSRFPKLGLAAFAVAGYDEWYEKEGGDA
jgi:hypothetical protein